MYASATNYADTTVKDPLPKSQWINWCRLCAKVENKDSINLLYQNKEEEHSEYDGKKLGIQEALDKYFGVKTSFEDSLPKKLCSDCLSLVSFLINFNECVGRVQLMYQYLNDFHTITTNNSFDIDSVRLKYGVKDQTRNQYFCENAISEEDDVSTRCHVLETPDSPQFLDVDKKLEVQISLVNDVALYPLDHGNHVEENCVNDTEEKEDFCDDSNDNTQEEYGDSSDSNEEDEEEFHKNSLTNEAENHTKALQTDKIPVLSKSEKTMSFLMNVLKIDITCKKCDDKFIEYLTYRDHLLQKHNLQKKSKTWPCPLCDKSYKQALGLKEHVKAVHLQMIQCPECGKYYKSNAEIEEHIRYKHKKEKRFICEECGLGLMNATNLRKHMLRHTDITPYECKICKSRFKNEERLKRHMRTHSSERYTCNICGLQLKSKITYKNHLVVHSDIAQYKCDYCDKSFKKKRDLKPHLLVHIGLKPFSCNFCERTFSTSWNCNLHVKRTHPVEYAEQKALGGKIITNNMPKFESLKAIANNLINKEDEPST